MINNDTWRTRLQNSRKAANYTLRHAAKVLHTTPQTLLSYETSNSVVYPKLDLFYEMCRLYNVSFNYIIYGTEEGLSVDRQTQDIMATFVSLIVGNKASYSPAEKCLFIKDNEIISYLNGLNDYLQIHEKYDKELFSVLIEMINRLK